MLEVRDRLGKTMMALVIPMSRSSTDQSCGAAWMDVRGNIRKLACDETEVDVLDKASKGKIFLNGPLGSPHRGPAVVGVRYLQQCNSKSPPVL